VGIIVTMIGAFVGLEVPGAKVGTGPMGVGNGVGRGVGAHVTSGVMVGLLVGGLVGVLVGFLVGFMSGCLVGFRIGFAGGFLIGFFFVVGIGCFFLGPDGLIRSPPFFFPCFFAYLRERVTCCRKCRPSTSAECIR